MRTYRSSSGPFSEKPFYELAEIESTCESELRKVGLLPSDPEPIRIDRFIEKRFGHVVSYDDLGPGLLGYTRFGARGVEAIVISQALDESGSRGIERRLNTTLAHEAGHGLLHAHLFAIGGRPPASLFGDGLANDAPKVLCRDGEISGLGKPTGVRPYRWWEFQANQAMGALLLPKPLVCTAMAPHLESRGKLGSVGLLPDHREAASRDLSDTFDVNPIVAKIRLDVLFPASSAAQLTL